MRNRSSWSQCVALSLCLVSLPALAAGGRVTSAEGGTLQRPGQPEMPLERGTTVQAGDTLNTGAAGGAQIWMEDDAVFALSRDTRFKIDELLLPAQQAGGVGRSVMTLVKGAMRAVSGLIGKGPRDVNELRTQLATMGIRGTTYSVALCTDGKCQGRKGKKLKDGLYVLVDDGVVAIANSGGKLEVPAGKIAYTASNRTQAVFVDDGPFFFLELEQQFEFDFEVEPDRDPIDPPIIEPPVSPS